MIPKLGLDAPTLALGPDARGRMQAPQIGGQRDAIWGEAYWWDVGAQPGQAGNAVVAGHVNRPDGSAAFTQLNRLVAGDTIEVVTHGGRTLNFVAREKWQAPSDARGDDPALARIFGPSGTPDLNLLMCWGAWNGSDYTRRLVVTATLAGPSPFPAAGS